MDLSKLGEFVTIAELKDAGVSDEQLEFVKKLSRVVFEHEGKFILRKTEVEEILKPKSEIPKIRSGLSIVLDESIYNWVKYKTNNNKRSLGSLFMESFERGFRVHHTYIERHRVPKELHDYIYSAGKGLNKNTLFCSAMNYLAMNYLYAQDKKL